MTVQLTQQWRRGNSRAAVGHRREIEQPSSFAVPTSQFPTVTSCLTTHIGRLAFGVSWSILRLYPSLTHCIVDPAVRKAAPYV